MANHISDDELRDTVKDGIANHTGEFANPWIFKKPYGHEMLTDILRDIMASNRLFNNLSKLITAREQAAYKRGYIQCGLDSQEKAK